MSEASTENQHVVQQQRRITVSVIVPVCHGGSVFHDCLTSLRNTDDAPDEIIVVTDGDVPEDKATASAFGLDVVSSPQRRGPAVARNLGAASATGDILFFVDADVVVHADSIGLVREFFGTCDADVAAVIGSYDDAPRAPNFLSQYKNLFHHFTHQHAREEGFTFWGACGAVRREVFRSLGGFSEAYPEPSIEDIEFGYRLCASGARIRVVKELQVMHAKAWYFVSLLKTEVFRRAIPWTRLILAHGRLQNDLNTGSSTRMKMVLSLALLGALCAAAIRVEALYLALLFAAALLLSDSVLIRFFIEKRGWWFAARAMGWQWFYYLYCVFALGVGVIEHMVLRVAAGGADA